MMIDAATLLSDNQNLAQVAGTYASTNTYDLWGGSASVPTIPGLGGSVIHDIGRAEEPDLIVQVTTAFVGATATVQAQLFMADSADLATNPVKLQETDLIPVATLVAGYQFRLQIPVGVSKRYLGLKYVIGTATTTAGNVTAGIAGDVQTTFVG